MDAKLDGVTIERLDLWGSDFGNDRLLQLLELSWFQNVRVLNLGDNRLTKKGLAPLFASEVGRRLRKLTLSYNRIGAAIQGVSGMTELTHLDLVYTNISGKALVKLGKADLPALSHLDLQAVTGHTTPGKLIMAGKMADEIKEVTLPAKELAGLLASPVAGGLQWLSLGGLALDADGAQALGNAELPRLKTLVLNQTKLGNSGLEQLAGGAGLTGLATLDLDGALTPRYTDSGVENHPDAKSEAAFAALGKAAFASHLESIILDNNVVGEIGLTALLAGSLPKLTDLGLAQTVLGDDGCQVLAGSKSPLTQLRVMSNGITSAGLAALLASDFAPQLTQLALHFNPLRDKGCGLVAQSERLSSLARLAMGGTGASDKTIAALVEGPVLPHLVLLNIFDNRISDDGARLLAEAEPASLRSLFLGKCGLTEGGIEALASLDLPVLNVAEQDPSSLPPRIVGGPALDIQELDHVPAEQESVPVPPGLGEVCPSSYWIGMGVQPQWAFVLTKVGEDYRASMIEVETKRHVEPEPPIDGSYFSFEFSPDGAWCAVMAPYRGLFIVDTKSGATTRLADSLKHQKAGVAWCDDRLVALDCDTDNRWEGRLEVYGRGDDGSWQREHQLGGFWVARDSIATIAGGRMVVIGGSKGAFLVAVQGSDLRYLGQLPIPSIKVFEAEGRTYMVSQFRHGYAVKGIDEALAAAFADSAPPEKLDLAADKWPE